MATTRIIPMHRNQGRTVLQSLSARTDYVMNPNKTEEGQLIRCYECEAATVDVEFLLAKQQYKAITGREVKEKVMSLPISCASPFTRGRSHRNRRKRTSIMQNGMRRKPAPAGRKN